MTNDTERVAVIEIEHLSARIAHQWVLTDINLTAYRGQALALIGGAGSGKSVLLAHIIGLLSPALGTVAVFDRNINELPPQQLSQLRRRWGVMFQHGALFSSLNVFDNIAFPMHELRKQGETIEEDVIRELVALKLSMVGLEPADAWKHPTELSGGMVKRVALARALALEAELLLLDEPTTGLDPISVKELDNLLIELRAELNLSIFMITHDLPSLAALADRVAVLDEGDLLTVGTLGEVAEFDHAFIRDFFKRRPGDEVLHALSAYWR